MNNNLPDKYKNNFFHNIINRIKLWFFNQKKSIDNLPASIPEITETTREDTKNNFAEEIKVDIADRNNDYEKRKFMENLTENPELLEEFSNDRLEKILQYYLDENNRKREMLKKLKSQC